MTDDTLTPEVIKDLMRAMVEHKITSLKYQGMEITKNLHDRETPEAKQLREINLTAPKPSVR